MATFSIHHTSLTTAEMTTMGKEDRWPVPTDLMRHTCCDTAAGAGQAAQYHIQLAVWCKTVCTVSPMLYLSVNGHSPTATPGLAVPTTAMRVTVSHCDSTWTDDRGELLVQAADVLRCQR